MTRERAVWVLVWVMLLCVGGVVIYYVPSPPQQVSSLERKEGHDLISKMDGPPEPVAEPEATIPLPVPEPEEVVVTARAPRYATAKVIDEKYQLRDLPDWSLERYTVELVAGKKSPVFVYKRAPYEYFGVAVVALADIGPSLRFDIPGVVASRVLAVDREVGIGIVSVSHSVMQDQAVEIDKPLANTMLKFCELPGTAADVFVLIQLIYGR